MEPQQKIQIGAVLRTWFAFSDPHRDAMFFHNVCGNPPHLIAKYRGATYRIDLNGSTWYCLGDVIRVPAPGNPFPRELATLQAAVAFRRFAPALPWIVFVFAGLVIAQMFLWNLPDAPVDELRMNFVAMLGVWMNTLLLIGVCLCVAVLLLWNFGKGIRVNLNPPDEQPMLLDAGMPDISPDIFLMSESPDETPDNFLRRWTDAQAGQRPGQWIVRIAFRRPEAVILTGTEDVYKFVRDCPDYQGRDWPEEMRIVPPGTRFASETWQEYIEYCRTFASHYPEWAKVEKNNMANDLESLQDAIRAEAQNSEL